MRRISALGALVGLVIGFAILGILAGIALFKDSPGGVGENQMWFGAFATVWGLPLTAMAQAMVKDPDYSLAGILIAVPLNWSVLGFLAGTVTELFRRRRGPQRATV